MMPISNYKELIDTLRWDTNKRENEGWYVFLIMNPMNQTNAGIDIIKNFSYLDVRTGNVTFFVPGFSNLDQGVVPYRSYNGDTVVYEDDTFGTLYFDQRGFLQTIAWLERGSGYNYRYSEELDLVVIKYSPINISDRGSYEQNFNLQSMIIYNLDRLKEQGVNTLRMITECMNVVSSTNEESEVRGRIDGFISDRLSHGERTGPVNHANQKINVFVAGAKALRRERDAVISALNKVSSLSRTGYTFNVKTYESFERSLTEKGRQAEYNDYISEDADYAIFILDNTVGGITYDEFHVALNAYNTKQRPQIYVYSHIPRISQVLFQSLLGRVQGAEVKTIIDHLTAIGQYYIEYSDIDDLKAHIAQDFRKYSL